MTQRTGFPPRFYDSMASFFLRGNTRTVLLGCRHGRVDVLATPQETVRCLREIRALAETDGLRLLFSTKHRGIFYLYLVAHDFSGDVLLVRLFERLDFCGMVYLDAHAVRERAIFDKGFYVPDPVDKAFVDLVRYDFIEQNPVAENSDDSATYAALDAYPDALAEQLVAFFGVEKALDIEKQLQQGGKAPVLVATAHGPVLARAMWQQGLAAIVPFMRYLYHRMQDHLRTPRILVTIHGERKQQKQLLALALAKKFAPLERWLRIGRASKPQKAFLPPLRHIHIYVGLTAATARKKACKGGLNLLLGHELAPEKQFLLACKHIGSVLHGL